MLGDPRYALQKGLATALFLSSARRQLSEWQTPRSFKSTACPSTNCSVEKARIVTKIALVRNVKAVILHTARVQLQTDHGNCSLGGDERAFSSQKSHHGVCDGIHVR